MSYTPLYYFGGGGGTGGVGPQGPPGPTGLQGPTGIQGPTGLQGPQGLQGGTGLQGSSGAVGSTGLQGISGIQGPTGLQGPTGNQGIQGPSGISGTIGITGVQGPAGGVGSVTALTGFPEITATGVKHNQILTSIAPSVFSFLYSPLPIINVKDFGASGNNTTNDLQAIQRAVTTWNTSGGTLYFPYSGTYRIILTGHPSAQLTNRGNNEYPVIYSNRNNTSIVIDNGAVINFVPQVPLTGMPVPTATVPFFGIRSDNVNIDGGRINLIPTGLSQFGQYYNGYPIWKNSGTNINLFGVFVSGFVGESTNNGPNNEQVNNVVRCEFYRHINNGLDAMFRLNNSHNFKYCNFFTFYHQNSGRGPIFNLDTSAKITHIEDNWFLSVCSGIGHTNTTERDYCPMIITGATANNYEFSILDNIFEGFGKHAIISGTSNIKISTNWWGENSGSLYTQLKAAYLPYIIIPNLDLNTIGWHIINSSGIDIEGEQSCGILLSGAPSNNIRIKAGLDLLFRSTNNSNNVNVYSTIFMPPESNTNFNPSLFIGGGSFMTFDSCHFRGKALGTPIWLDNTITGVNNITFSKCFIEHPSTGFVHSIVSTGVGDGPSGINFISNMIASSARDLSIPMYLDRGSDFVLSENSFVLSQQTGITYSLSIGPNFNTGCLLFHNVEVGGLGSMSGILLNAPVQKGINILGHHSATILGGGTGSFAYQGYLSTGTMLIPQ